MEEQPKGFAIARTVAVLLAIAALTVAVFLWRDRLSEFALIGYPAVFVACFLLNSGVFGLSPSGVVAVEASFIFNPFITAIVAGLGAGAGEMTSYFAGKTSCELLDTTKVDAILDKPPVVVAVITFVASFISGNLSDALGVVIGRNGNALVPYMVGATLAKVVKMVILVALAHYGTEFLASLGIPNVFDYLK